MVFKKQIAKVCIHCNKKHLKSTKNALNCLVGRDKERKMQKKKKAEKQKQSRFVVVKTQTKQSEVNNQAEINHNQAQDDNQSQDEGQQANEMKDQVKDQDDFKTPHKKGMTYNLSTIASIQMERNQDPIVNFPENQASQLWFQYFQYYEGKQPFTRCDINRKSMIFVKKSLYDKINQTQTVHFQCEYPQKQMNLQISKFDAVPVKAGIRTRRGFYQTGKQSRISRKRINAKAKIIQKKGSQYDLMKIQRQQFCRQTRLAKKALQHTKYDIWQFDIHKQWTNAVKNYRKPAYTFKIDDQYLLKYNRGSSLCKIKTNKREIIVTRRHRNLWKCSSDPYVRRIQFALHYNPWMQSLVDPALVSDMRQGNIKLDAIQQKTQRLKKPLLPEDLDAGSLKLDKWITIQLTQRSLLPIYLKAINSISFQLTQLGFNPNFQSILLQQQRNKSELKLKLKREQMQKLQSEHEEMKKIQMLANQMKQTKQTMQLLKQLWYIPEKIIRHYKTDYLRLCPRFENVYTKTEGPARRPIGWSDDQTIRSQAQKSFNAIRIQAQTSFKILKEKTKQQAESAEAKKLKRYLRKSKIDLLRQKMGASAYRQMCRMQVNLEKHKIRQAQKATVKQMEPLQKIHDQEEMTPFQYELDQLYIGNEKKILLSKKPPIRNQIRQLKKSHGYWKFCQQAVQRKMVIGKLDLKCVSLQQTIVQQWFANNCPVPSLGHQQNLLYWQLIKRISEDKEILHQIGKRQFRRNKLRTLIMQEQKEKDRHKVYENKWFDRDLDAIFKQRVQIDTPQIKQLFTNLKYIQMLSQQSSLKILNNEFKLSRLSQMLEKSSLQFQAMQVQAQIQSQKMEIKHTKIEDETCLTDRDDIPFKHVVQTWSLKYIEDNFKLWGQTGKKKKIKSKYFTTPQNPGLQQKRYFDSQMKTFLIAKKLDPKKFIFRRNLFHPTFEHSKQYDERDIRIATRIDQQILKDYQLGKYVLPVCYRYVNELIGAGLDATRNISKGQFMGWFSGYVMSQQEANRLKDNHNMCFYASTKNGDYVMSTCFGYYSMGPMYNSAQKDTNIELAGIMTRQMGLQYVFTATKDIKEGQHLVWNYNSGGDSYILQDNIDIRKLLKHQSPLQGQIGSRMQQIIVDEAKIKSRAVHYLEQQIIDVRPRPFGRLQPIVSSHSCKKKV